PSFVSRFLELRSQPMLAGDGTIRFVEGKHERRIQDQAAIRPGFRKTGEPLFSARPGKARRGADFAAAYFHSHRAGVGAAQLRRQKSVRAGREDAGQLEREKS